MQSVPQVQPVTHAAAVQMNSTENTARNLQTAERLIREAAARGATLVVLPEKWPVLGHGEVMRRSAEPLEGPAMALVRGLARELAIEIVAGSFVERRERQERTCNTSAHVGSDGEVRGLYRKLHMFDVEVDGVAYAESEHEQAGDRVTVSKLDNGRLLGMSICYDLRFPELYRELSGRGAQLLTVPSAFTLATTRDHWEPLLRARAIENQSFVVAANQTGAYLPGHRSGGRSMIVDPWGTVLATAPDRECVILAELAWERLEEIRASLPVLTHRRPPELYSR